MLCGHKLRGRDPHRKGIEEILPCVMPDVLDTGALVSVAVPKAQCGLHY